MDIISKYFPALSEKQLRQFASLGDVYKEWNSKINVISRKDMDGLYDKHVLHSLGIGRVFQFPAGLRMIDIGTGGGFPGIPLAILFPDCHFHLVDSIGKKLKVVEAVAKAAEIENITLQQARVEEMDQPGHLFDFALSRAVAPLKELWHWSKPLIKAGTGTRTIDIEALPVVPPSSGLICLKGGDLATEIRESGIHPTIVAFNRLFTEPFFTDKFLLYIPRK